MAVRNRKGFAVAVNDFQRQFDKTGVEIFKAIVLESLARIIERTPVETGRLRGNWQVGIVTAPDRELTTTDKQGTVTQTMAEAVLDEVELDTRVIIVNNLPYARVVEEGLYPGDGPRTANGYSTLAPQGMVEVTFAEMDQIIKDATSRFR